MSVPDSATPHLILEWWQNAHGSLSQALVEKFMIRPELEQLCQLPPEIVKPAIGNNVRLSVALTEAKKEAHRRWGPLGRPSVSGRPTWGSDTGLIRNPGKPESPIGDRCEQCDAFVPGGAVHECHF